jgi:uncharacterized protein (TIGR02996 family)
MVRRLYHEEERYLRQAIAQAPDDDLPRLVLADWLEEQGRSIEAEFIRVQLVSARLEVLSRAEQQRHVAIYRRQNELLEQQQQTLLRHVPEPLRQEGYFDFHRGLVCAITAPLRLLLPYATELQQLIPLPHICLQDTVEAVRRTIGCPTASSASRAGNPPQGGHAGTPGEHFQELTGVLHAIRTAVSSRWVVPPGGGRVLRRDGLASAGREETHGMGEAGPLRAEAIPAFPRLEVLDLAGAELGDDNLRQLFQAAARFPRLQYLDISANDIQDDTVAALLQTPWPRQLRRLILGGNLLTDRTARLLTEQWPEDTPLEDLNLRFTAIGHEGRRLLIHRFGGRVALF